MQFPTAAASAFFLSFALSMAAGCELGLGTTEENEVDAGREEIPFPEEERPRERGADGGILNEKSLDAGLEIEEADAGIEQEVPPPTDAGAASLGAQDAGIDEEEPPILVGQPGFAQPPITADLPAGWVYVRTHEPFISGLVTSMGEVPAAAVTTYFDDFNATALHLWADGLGAPLDSWQQLGDVPWVSWTMDNGRSASNNLPLGGGAANAPGRIGYQIGDEPTDQAGFDSMQEGLNAARAGDPDGLVIFNWTYNAGDLLPSFFDTSASWGVDVFSYDTYSTSRNVYERYAQFSAPCREHGIPCWRYLDSYNDASHDTVLEATDMRWDAMAGLVWGYTGHTWFLYQISEEHGLTSAFFDAVGDWSASTTSRFDVAAEVNRELYVLGESINQLDHHGGFLAVHWPRVPDWGVSLAWPPNVDAWEPGVGGDPYLVDVGCPENEADMDLPIGFFSDGFGSRYIVVQNGRHANASWPNQSPDAGEVELHFDFSDAPDEVESTFVRALNNETGTLMDLPLVELRDGTKVLTHTLDAGEVLLLKYADGRPFARRMP